MTVPNLPHLRKTLEHIKAHPREWEQAQWRCASGVCFAGHAAILSGAVWTKPDDPFSPFVVDPETDESVHVRDFAQGVLGLDVDEADTLFHSTNTLEEIEEVIEYFEEVARS